MARVKPYIRDELPTVKRCFDRQSTNGEFVLGRAQPLLSRDEEHELALRKHTDPAARERLIMSNIKFASKIAGQYKGYGLPFDDLLSSAIEGLILGVDRYDANSGFVLLTYAVHWVKQRIGRYVYCNLSLLRTPHGPKNRKLFWNLNRVIKENTLDDFTDYNAVAAFFDMSVDQVRKAEEYMKNCTLYEELPIDAANTDDPFQDAVKAEQREFCEKYLSKLKYKQREILKMRNADDPWTLDAIGERFGCTRENIRQHELNALKKIRRLIRVYRAGDPRE